MRPKPRLAVLLLLAACGAPDGIPETPSAPDDLDPGVVAIFDGGQVSAEDIDRLILGLPPQARRRAAEQTLEEWYRELARRIAADAVLRRQAERRGIADDAETVAARKEAARQIEVQLCQQKLPEIRFDALTEDELRQAYAERREQWVSPELRRVYHVYLRREGGVGSAELSSRLEVLRDRVLNGESFPLLAKEHSQSESRHRDGLLGEVERGQLVPQLEEVIFDLIEGVPSDPVISAEGGHLFFVDNVFPRREFPFDEIRDRLAEELTAERRQQAIDDWEAQLSPPPDSLVPAPEQLRAALRQGAEEDVVLRIGDFELTLGELREQAARARRLQRSGARRPMGLVQRLLRDHQRTALVRHHCRERRLVDPGELEAAVAGWQRQALVPIYRQRRVRELVEGDPARLRSFFDANPGRFSSPPRWRLRRLSVPLAGDAVGAMARLEAARPELDAGSLRLERLARELGGKVDDLGWRTLAQVRNVRPRAARLVSALEAGEHTPPFRGGGASILMLQALEREEPEPRPFEQVREGVLEAYLQQHGEALDREMIDGLLADAGYRVFPERFDAVRQARGRRTGGELDEVLELLEAIEDGG